MMSWLKHWLEDTRDFVLKILEPDQARGCRAVTVVDRIARYCQGLFEERQKLQRKLDRAVAKNDSQNVVLHSTELAILTARLEFLRQFMPRQFVEAPRIAQKRVQQFAFSSLMLWDSFRYCTRRPEEGMHFVLGVEQRGVLIGTKLMPIRYNERSIVSASTDDVQTQRMAIKASESGHVVMGLIHSHPGDGIQRPSGTDMRTQRNWESGWRFVSGIWGRDGYVRFLSDRLQFSVHVLGNHVEQVSDNVFKLKLEELNA